MPVAFALTPSGPPTFTLEQVRAGLVQDWLAQWGNADTSPESPDGQLIDLSALPQLLLWQAQAQLWLDSFVRTARGTALDQLLDAFGKVREAAEASVAAVVFYGAENTAVAQGTQVQATGSDVRFATADPATTGLLLGSDTWMVRIPAAIVGGTTYTIDIDGTPYDRLAAGIDTPTTVADDLTALVNLGADGTALRAGLDADGRALVIVDVTGGPGIVTASDDGAATTDGFPGVRVTARSADTGPIVATAGTLQLIPTPIAGIVGVSSGTDASLGSNEETDDEFRARHLASVFGPGCGTDQAIEDRVRRVTDANGLRFIETVSTTSNRSSVVDSEGRDPHSCETVVRYRDGAPTDADFRVATAIGECLPSGILAFGLSFTENIEIRPGNFVAISATIVTPLYLHLDVTVTKGEGWPASLTDAAAEVAIATAIAQDWQAARVEGQDWYRTTVSGSVNRVVANAAADIVTLSDLTALPTDPPVFAAVSVQVAAAREIIEADSGRVSVTLV